MEIYKIKKYYDIHMWQYTMVPPTGLIQMNFQPIIFALVCL